MRVAIDVGFGFIKAVNENGKTECFPSVIAKRGESSISSFVGKSDPYSIIYWEVGENGKKNEKRLYVGDAALTNGGVRKWKDKDQKLDTEDIKVFISVALAVLSEKNEPFDICVGLPISYFNSKKEELENILSSIDARISISGKLFVHEIKINSVYIYPQGIGAYYSALFDLNGKPKDIKLVTKSVGVIDIGYRTVDYIVMGRGKSGIVFKDHLSGSLEEDGMNKAIKQVADSISTEVNREIGTNEVEKAILWFDNELEYRGQKYNLSKYVDAAYKDLSESISSKLKLKWGLEGDMLEQVIITGGGGGSLFPYLKENFEHAILQDKAEFANAAGYLGAQMALSNKKGA